MANGYLFTSPRTTMAPIPESFLAPETAKKSRGMDAVSNGSRRGSSGSSSWPLFIDSPGLWTAEQSAARVPAR